MSEEILEETESTMEPKKRGPKAERKTAPTGVKVGIPGQGERKAILARLDETNPEFVHMYQHPSVLSGNAENEWELESKGQEVVRREDGKIVHHKGDPVVRVSRTVWENERTQEGEFSRKQVESVVKSQRSTVKRRRKEQIE